MPSNRIPASAPPDVQGAFREVWAYIDRFMGSRNVDMHQRRFINAGAAVDPKDYVTLEQVQALVGGTGVTSASESPAAVSAIGRFVAIFLQGLQEGAILFGASGGSITSNHSRFRWNETGFDLTIEGNIISADWRANTIEVGYGGTGLTAGTSGGVLAYTAPDVLQSSEELAAGRLIVGGGAGAVPATAAVLSADPATLNNGDVWIVASGVSPARTIELKVRDGGATHVLSTITY